ncbi:MAG: hypothetical protein V1886_00630 [archaeon]
MNKNNTKTILAALALILIAVAMTSNALALGISPGRLTLNFEQGMQRDVQITVINTEHRDMNVVFGATGELASYITLKSDSPIVRIGASENEKTLTYSVSLPAKLTPGEHEAKITVTELPPEGGADGVQIGAMVVVASQLLVKVPYPYKYAAIVLSSEHFEAGSSGKFYVEVDNLGEQDLVGMQATIEIISAANQKIAVLKTDSKTINSGTKGELQAAWKADVNPGNYRIVATLPYDEGKLASSEKIISVGSLVVDIVDISVRNFRLGDIAKFDITVESKWSEKISDIYAQLQIQDEQENLIANVKTPSIELSAMGRSVLNAYWDTAGVKEGVYSGKLLLNFANQVLERQLKTEIALTSIKVEIIGVGISARAVSAESGKQNMMFVLVLAVLLLVVINIAWFVYFNKKIKKKKSD